MTNPMKLECMYVCNSVYILSFMASCGPVSCADACYSFPIGIWVLDACFPIGIWVLDAFLLRLSHQF